MQEQALQPERPGQGRRALIAILVLPEQREPSMAGVHPAPRGGVRGGGKSSVCGALSWSPGGNPAVLAVFLRRHGEGLAVTMRDETQRAQAGQALASKERNLSALLANLPMGVAFVEVGTGKPPLVNQHLRDLLGLVGEQEDPELFAPGHLYDLGGNVLDAKDLPARVAMRGWSWLPSTQFGQPNVGSAAS